MYSGSIEYVRAIMEDLRRETATRLKPSVAEYEEFSPDLAVALVSELRKDLETSSQFDIYNRFTGIGCRRLHGPVRHAEVSIDNITVQNEDKRFYVYDISPAEVAAFEANYPILSSTILEKLSPKKATSLAEEVCIEDLHTSVLIEVDESEEGQLPKILGYNVHQTNNGREPGVHTLETPIEFSQHPSGQNRITVDTVLANVDEMLGWKVQVPTPGQATNPKDTEGKDKQVDLQSVESRKFSNLGEFCNPISMMTLTGEELLKRKKLFSSLALVYAKIFKADNTWGELHLEDPSNAEEYMEKTLESKSGTTTKLISLIVDDTEDQNVLGWIITTHPKNTPFDFTAYIKDSISFNLPKLEERDISINEVSRKVGENHSVFCFDEFGIDIPDLVKQLGKKIKSRTGQPETDVRKLSKEIYRRTRLEFMLNHMISLTARGLANRSTQGVFWTFSDSQMWMLSYQPDVFTHIVSLKPERGESDFPDIGIFTFNTGKLIDMVSSPGNFEKAYKKFPGSFKTIANAVVGTALRRNHLIKIN